MQKFVRKTTHSIHSTSRKPSWKLVSTGLSRHQQLVASSQAFSNCYNYTISMTFVIFTLAQTHFEEARIGNSLPKFQPHFASVNVSLKQSCFPRKPPWIEQNFRFFHSKRFQIKFVPTGPVPLKKGLFIDVHFFLCKVPNKPLCDLLINLFNYY